MENSPQNVPVTGTGTIATTVTATWTQPMTLITNAPAPLKTVLQGPPLTKEERKAAEKEQRRLARIDAWYKKAKENSKKWFKAELAAIIADNRANAWRPEVHSHDDKMPAFELCYWSLARENCDHWHPDGEPTWRTYRNRYNAGWVGITVSQTSPFEEMAINDFLSKLRKKDYLKDTEPDYECNVKDIGEYPVNCHGIWFRNLDDHNQFVEMLRAIPKRDYLMDLGDGGDIDGIMNLLSGMNYWIIEGRHKSLLHVCQSQFNDTNIVLLKMFVG
jgi:hypothetical protein